MSSVSNQVRRAIETCGVSRYRISKETGVSQAVLSRFMSGQASLTLDTVDRIAYLLPLTVKVARAKRSKRR